MSAFGLIQCFIINFNHLVVSNYCDFTLFLKLIGCFQLIGNMHFFILVISKFIDII